MPRKSSQIASKLSALESGARRYAPQPSPRFFTLWAAIFALSLALSFHTGIAPAGATEFVDSLTERLAAASRIFEEKVTAPRIEAAHTAVTPPPLPIVAATPRIIAPAAGIASRIVFPTKSDFDTLNAALLEGVVHYPGSALPGEEGNVFLFGHSTGLAVVHNKAFEVFNTLSKLEAGDIVRLRYGDREYWYSVRSVTVKKADEALVELKPTDGRKLLTMSTCRIFGAKDDRFVVEAEFVKSYPLRSS